MACLSSRSDIREHWVIDLLKCFHLLELLNSPLPFGLFASCMVELCDRLEFHSFVTREWMRQRQVQSFTNNIREHWVMVLLICFHLLEFLNSHIGFRFISLLHC